MGDMMVKFCINEVMRVAFLSSYKLCVIEYPKLINPMLAPAMSLKKRNRLIESDSAVIKAVTKK